MNFNVIIIKGNEKMNNLEERRNLLFECYSKWADQLDKSLLSNNYSNPYYVSIPDDWFDNGKIRIMIVGEEGAGNWGCGKTIWKGFNDTVWECKSEEDIKRIQEYNSKQTYYQLSTTQKDKWYKKNNGRFWNRIRSIKMINSDKVVIVWNNLDKIHGINEYSPCLNPADREKLHSTKIKILAEEIKILEPNIIVFCGWSKRENAFKAELSSEFVPVYNKFFKKINGRYECEQFKDHNNE